MDKDKGSFSLFHSNCPVSDTLNNSLLWLLIQPVHPFLTLTITLSIQKYVGYNLLYNFEENEGCGGVPIADFAEGCVFVFYNIIWVMLGI